MEFECPECPSCGSQDIVTDTKQGHMVCGDGGIIPQSSMISAQTECRKFSRTEKDSPKGKVAYCIAVYCVPEALCKVDW